MKAPEQWIKQSEYDLKTAKAMFDSKRYIYSVFMCHLSLEKALKAHYSKILKKDPPKTHNLNYLYQNIKLKLSEDDTKFIDILNNLSIPTRYPDDIEKLIKEYRKNDTLSILTKSEKLLKWLKKNL